MEKSEKRKKKLAKQVNALPIALVICTVSTDKPSAIHEDIDKRKLKSYPPRFINVRLIQPDGDNEAWGLPYGYTHLEKETLSEAALRLLSEHMYTNQETLTESLDAANLHVQQLMAYYRPSANPSDWTPTITYVVFGNEQLLQRDLQSTEIDSEWFHVSLSDDHISYASDDGEIVLQDKDLTPMHGQMLRDAFALLTHLMMTTTIASTFLPEEFTIAQLYQIITTVIPTYGMSSTNFTRDLVKTKSRDHLLELVYTKDGTPKKSTQYSARPAQLYRIRSDFQARPSIYPRV